MIMDDHTTRFTSLKFLSCEWIDGKHCFTWGSGVEGMLKVQGLRDGGVDFDLWPCYGPGDFLEDLEGMGYTQGTISTPVRQAHCPGARGCR